MSAKRGMIAGGIAMASRASNQICVIVVTLIATRFLTPADFGILSLATALVMLARTLLYSGPFEYLVKARDLHRAATETLAATMLIASAGTLAVMLLAFVLPLVFGSAAVGRLMLLLAPSILISALASWQEALVLRGRRLHSYYVLTMTVEIVAAAVAVVALLLGYGLLAIVLQTYVRAAALACAYRMMTRPPPLQRIDRVLLRDIMRWSAARYGSVFVTFLSNYSGDFVLGAVLSPAATGVFRAGNRIVTAVADVFVQPARMIAMTNLSRRFAAGLAPDGHWLRLFGGIAFIGVPGLAGVAVLSDWLAPVALGPGWAAAGPVITILALARMTALLSSVASTLLVSYDRQGQVFWIQLATAIAIAGLTIAMAPIGVSGAALAAGIVLAASAALFTGKAIALGPPSRAEWRDVAVSVGLPLFATIGGAWIGRLLAQSLTSLPVAQLAIAVACGGIAWSVACVVARHAILRNVACLRVADLPRPVPEPRRAKENDRIAGAPAEHA